MIEYTLKGSFLEIYNDRIYDLLDVNSFALSIHEDAKRGVFVSNLCEKAVHSAADCLALMQQGAENRFA